MNIRGGQRLKKAFALLLCIALLGQQALALSETEGVMATPTALVTAAPAPAAAAADSPTGTQADPTAQPSEPAADTETPEATVTPGESGSSLPTDTDVPPATTSPGDTTAPEDTPPICTVEGCTHIVYGPDGTPTAICPLGEWMLAHGEGLHKPTDQMPASAMFTVASPGAVTLTAGTTAIYRSGTYILSGGSDTSTVTVHDKLAVALVLRGATIGHLQLGDHVSMEVDFTQKSVVGSMHAGSGQIVFDGTGSLTVGEVDDLSGADLSMAGGSIDMPSGAASGNGRVRFDCDAAGASSATVDGASYPFTTPDAGGRAHLWLPALGGGDSYNGAVSGGVLVVRSVEADPSVTDAFDMDGTDEFTAAANHSTSIISSGGVPKNHLLVVDQSGVSLVFGNILLGSAADIRMDVAGRMHVNGACSVGDIGGSGTVSLTGSGTLYADAINASALRCAGSLRVTYGAAGGSWQSGWRQLTSPIDLATVTGLTYNGKAYAIASMAGEASTFYARLPAPAGGMKYDVQASGTALKAIQIPEGTQTLTLTNAGLSITANGDYVILADGATTGAITVAGGVRADILLRSVSTGGSLALGTGAGVQLALEGSNRFGGGISVAGSATLSVSGQGALLSGAVSGDGSNHITVAAGTNLSLASGSKLGKSTLQPTLIQVTDAGLSPITNRALTLRIGTDNPFATTTGANGMVTLWASRSRTNASVVVLSQANTYAEILTGTTANPEGLPEITAVTGHPQGYVTYQTTGAQTSGVQAYIGRGGVDMPDTFVPTALHVPRLFGECNIPGIKTGDVITYRVYAAKQAGQTLSAATADAFQFSDTYTFTVGTPRKMFKLGSQSKEYDRAAFSFGSGVIPHGATVTYFKGTTELHAAPSEVGEYTAVIAIPAGHDDYIPATVSVKVTIRRKVVLIQPEPASKIKGQPDPPFVYAYTGTFDGDTVTGPLGREKGEFHGNYPYHTKWLVAADYYELVIDPTYPMFFIDWGPGHYIKVDPLSIIDPVHQVLTFSDGKKLDLILRTGDRLTISGVSYGTMVIDPDDRRTRPFTPELRLKHGYDQALLIIQAEPEINDDGGYATDADGKLILSPRTVSLSQFQLARFKAQRITALAFRLQGVMFVLDLTQLESDAVRAAMVTAGMTQMGVRYQITLQPVGSVKDLAAYPEDVQTDKALGDPMTHVRIEAVSGGKALDISWLVSGARTAFDASALLADAAEKTPEIAEITLGRKQGEEPDDNALTAGTMELVQRIMQEKLTALGVRMNYYDDGIQTLDSQLVVPYTASETDVLPYTALMQTSPYLITRHLRNGLYGLHTPVTP